MGKLTQVAVANPMNDFEKDCFVLSYFDDHLLELRRRLTKEDTISGSN